MRENFQNAAARSAKKFCTACNSSCGKFTANIFSLHGRIRVKTLGIYSSVLTLGNLLVLSCPVLGLCSLCCSETQAWRHSGTAQPSLNDR